MAKSYKIDGNKIVKTDKVSFGSPINKSIEDFDKSIVELGGSGEWRSLHGVKLFVDPSGVVIKGPDIFISRKWDDLERLTFQDTNTVMLSVMRAIGATNKSYEDEIDKQNKQKIINEANEYLDKAIEIRKKAYNEYMNR